MIKQNLSGSANVNVLDEAQLGKVVGGNRGGHRKYNYGHCYDKKRYDYCNSDYNYSDRYDSKSYCDDSDSSYDETATTTTTASAPDLSTVTAHSPSPEPVASKGSCGLKRVHLLRSRIRIRARSRKSLSSPGQPADGKTDSRSADSVVTSLRSLSSIELA